MLNKLRNRLKKTLNGEIKPQSSPPTHIMEGNNYRDRWFVGLIFMDNELKRWLNSLGKDCLANGKKAAHKILDAYQHNHKELDLSNLGLTWLPASCVSLLQNLKHLDLSRNYLSTVKSNGIDKLVDLVKLDLSANNLKEITGLGNLRKLTSLDISANQIGGDLYELLVLPDHVLHEVVMGALRNPNDLTEEKLGVLPKIARAIKNREEKLELSHSGLSHVPMYLQLVRNLKELNLSFNLITKLKATDLTLPSLTTLDLSCNKLTTLPASCFASLQNLKNLNLSRNHLTTTKLSGIDKLVNLVNLNLHLNSLMGITGLGKLRKLTSLYISANQSLADIRELLVFPDTVLHEVVMCALKNPSDLTAEERKALPKIAEAIENRAEKLDLSHIGLCRIPIYLQLVRNLKELNLSYNKLSQVKGIDLISPSLRVLNLSHNQLTTLTGVGSLTCLRELNVENNSLMHVNATLEPLTKLRRFFSSGNKLQENPSIARSRSDRVWRSIKGTLPSFRHRASQLSASMNSIPSPCEFPLTEFNSLEVNCLFMLPLLGRSTSG